VTTSYEIIIFLSLSFCLGSSKIFQSSFKRKIFAGTPANSYHHITWNLDEMVNEMEGLGIFDYFVIEDLKKMTIGTT